MAKKLHKATDLCSSAIKLKRQAPTITNSKKTKPDDSAAAKIAKQKTELESRLAALEASLKEKLQGKTLLALAEAEDPSSRKEAVAVLEAICKSAQVQTIKKDEKMEVAPVYTLEKLDSLETKFKEAIRLVERYFDCAAEILEDDTSYKDADFCLDATTRLSTNRDLLVTILKKQDELNSALGEAKAYVSNLASQVRDLSPDIEAAMQKFRQDKETDDDTKLWTRIKALYEIILTAKEISDSSKNIVDTSANNLNLQTIKSIHRAALAEENQRLTTYEQSKPRSRRLIDHDQRTHERAKATVMKQSVEALVSQIINFVESILMLTQGGISDDEIDKYFQDLWDKIDAKENNNIYQVKDGISTAATPLCAFVDSTIEELQDREIDSRIISIIEDLRDRLFNELLVLAVMSPDDGTRGST